MNSKIMHVVSALFLWVLLSFTNTFAQDGTSGTEIENSLSVNDLMARAFLTNPAVKSAQEKLEAELARGRSLGQSLYNPTLDLEYENSDQVTKSIGISQTIDWRGKRTTNQNLAQIRTEKARLEYKIARNNVMASIAKAISDYERNNEILSLREKSLNSATELASYAQSRHLQGDITLKELQTANLALFRARTEKNNAMSAMLGAKQLVEALTGVEAMYWSLTYLSNLPLPPLEENINRESPSLLLSQAAYFEKKAEVEVARKRRSVDPTVGVKYGKEGDSDLIGVNLSVPLPIRNTFSHDFVASQKDMQSSEFDFENKKRLYEATLISNHSRISLLSSSWQSWQSGDDKSLDNQYELMARLLENDEISTLNYLLEIEQLFQTEEAIIDMRFNLEVAWIDWFELTGNFNEWMEN